MSWGWLGNDNLISMAASVRLNLRKLQHLAGRALQNGVALHFDSILLFKNRSYGTAHFISVLAMEEIGKAFAAEHFAWSERTNGPADSDFHTEWIAWLLSDHRGKQLAFLRERISDSTSTRYFDVLHRHLENRKHDSIYVGLSRPPKGSPRTGGNLIYPQKFTRKQAHEQLKHVHDFILGYIDGIERGSVQLDLMAFNRILTSTLRERLGTDI